MTIEQARKHPGYKEAYEKILGYRKGFRFTINFVGIPKAKLNGLKLVLDDACKHGILKSVSMGYDLSMTQTDETYERV